MHADDKNESAESPPAWFGLGGSGRGLALRVIQQARAYRVFPGPVPVMVLELDVLRPAVIGTTSCAHKRR